MKRVLASVLGLGICLSPLRGVTGGVEIDWRSLSVGSQGRELLAQGIDSRKAEADRLLQQGIKQLKTSQFEAALQSSEQALIIYKQIKDRGGENGFPRRVFLVVLGRMGWLVVRGSCVEICGDRW